ncbi:class I tRNA ligase family protein [Vibrio ostreicida]|uniref:class I tRNA ligase family protein n=1 Tax=Vibrio ostreicida TaxID=526588 RepID=UPI000970A60E|nr:class I tRNA ligase family protein [Vibrio ostreicida]
MNKQTVVTAAFPFIPAELCIAHFASTYLPADIIHRFECLKGGNSIFVSATDVHGLWAQKELSQGQTTRDELMQSWHHRYLNEFQMLGIEFTHYGRTDAKALQQLVYQSLNKLKADGAITQREADDYMCGDCGEVLPRRYRLAVKETSATGKEKIAYDELSDGNLQCRFCESENVIKDSKLHWFLDLQQGLATILDSIEQQKNLQVSTQLKSVVAEGLADWNISRDNYMGTKLPFSDEQSLYLWYESLIGYLYLAECEGSNKSFTFKHFIGKNIIYYHGVVWPYLLHHGSDRKDCELQISARGFLDMEKTDDALVNIETLTSQYDKDYLRFYLAYRTPDSLSDYYFTKQDFTNTINQIFCNQFGSFFRRCISIFQKNHLDRVLPNELANTPWDNHWPQIEIALSQMQVRSVLLHIQSYIKACGSVIEDLAIYRTPTMESLGLLGELFIKALFLLAPICPTRVQDFNIIAELDLSRLRPHDDCVGLLLNKTTARWEKID